MISTAFPSAPAVAELRLSSSRHHVQLSAVVPSLIVAPLLIAVTVSSANLATARSRAGDCPDYRPQPTRISKPNTIWLPSPNFGERSDSRTAIDSVVIHTTEVPLAGTLDIFQNRANAVSAHFVVAPSGAIYEMVDTASRAWHATYYNSRSIGIEMVGFAAQPSTWNENNLNSLVDLLSWIVTAYPEIPLVHPESNAYDFANNQLDVPGLVAHGQVQPWNRSDPGRFFPWDDVLSQVAARVEITPEPSSTLLMTLGCLGMLTPRRHRCRRALIDG